MTLSLNLSILRWEGVADATGYDILLDGVKVSNAGPKARTTKIAIPVGSVHEVTIVAQPSGERQRASLEWASLGEDPSPTAFDIPYWRVTLPISAANIARWRMYKTATSGIVDGNPHMATPAFPRAITPKSWEWWVLGSVVIPASFPTVGRTFATINPHNAPGDVGGIAGVHGGVGWGFGSGVSAIHIFYSNGRPEDATQGANDFGLYVDPSGGQTHHWKLVPDVERDHRYDFAYQVILGRTDKELGLAGPGVPGGGIGDHPNGGAGKVRVWVDGQLVVDTGNINTLHRAKQPTDGKLYTQTLLYRPWDGAYCVPNLSAQVTMERSASRVGRTLQEALTDGSDGFTLVSEWESGSTQNLVPLSSKDFRAPSALA